MVRKHHDKKGTHIGFMHLEHDATRFYENKGYTHKEAVESGKKVAGSVNAKYVGHYRGWKSRGY